ncbi:hypothetical protein OQA88_3962 [Cercophora sp. LCS_1]
MAGSSRPKTPPPLSEVDDALVEKLIHYAAHDPECPPELKSYLTVREVVEGGMLGSLASAASSALSLIRGYLMSSEFQQLPRGPNLRAILQRYPTGYFGERTREGSLPPESATRAPKTPSKVVEVTKHVAEYLSPETARTLSWDHDSAIDVDSPRSERVRRFEPLTPAPAPPAPPSLPPPPPPSPPPPSPPPSIMSPTPTPAPPPAIPVPWKVNHAWEGIPDAKSELSPEAELKRLREIPMEPILIKAVKNNRPTERPILPSVVKNSIYRGQPQPPLRVRFKTVSIFLSDEDVDRCETWPHKFRDIVAYLNWLWYDDAQKQLHEADKETKDRFLELVQMALAHALFEEHHYGNTPLIIPEPTNLPMRSTRLDWAALPHNFPIPSRNPVLSQDNLLPRTPYPRDIQRVNLIDNKTCERKFKEAQASYWQGKDTEGNLARAEALHFEEQAGKVFGLSTVKDLSNKHTWTGSNKDKWAKERGLRRHGLQKALRGFSGFEQLGLGEGRVILPVSAASLRRAVQSAEGPQWVPPALPRSAMPAQLEPLPYNVFFGRYVKQWRIENQSALTAARAKDETAMLPRNLVAGGPFFWRYLDTEGQEKQDFLYECIKVRKLLKERLQVHPRYLIRNAWKILKHWKDPENTKNKLPEGTGIGFGDIKSKISVEGLQWLTFLTGESIGEKNHEGQILEAHESPDQFRLFLIFARRVQKLMHNKHKRGLFNSRDESTGRFQAVTVEQLLKAINDGLSNSAVIRHEFTPFEACQYLERLHDRYLVHFEPDITCYGVVTRPQALFHPEDRVHWTADGTFSTNLRTWDEVVGGRNKQTDEEIPQVQKAFLILAYKLGRTIHKLKRELEEKPKTTAADRTKLLDAVKEFQDERRKILDPPEELTTSPEDETDRPPAPERPDTRLLPLKVLVGRIGHRKEPPDLTVEESLTVIRHNIIQELLYNEPMLAPGREKIYHDAAGRTRVALVRDHSWEWASEPVRGKAKRFFDVNRWPLGTGYLTAAAEQAVKSDAYQDPMQTYDPRKTDPIKDFWKRERLRRIGEDNNVEFKPGTPRFPVGDTVFKRRKLEEYMTEAAYQAFGKTKPKETRLSKIADFINTTILGKRKRPEPRRSDIPFVPDVDPNDIPRSWDPQTETRRKERAEREATRLKKRAEREQKQSEKVKKRGEEYEQWAKEWNAKNEKQKKAFEKVGLPTDRVPINEKGEPI